MIDTLVIGKEPDPFHLDRFVAAQDAGGTYRNAVQELARGRKASHWMWFVFPQIHGLGFSSLSVRYAIMSLAEARAYLANPVLGGRLFEVTGIVADTANLSAEQIFGGVDARKLQSCMTLFAVAAPAEGLFATVLDLFFDGRHDAGTERILDGGSGKILSAPSP